MVFSLLTGSSPESPSNVPGCPRHGYECAPYSILENGEGYQVRSYPPAKWATVTQRGQPDNWQNRSFMKLFRYISGDNVGGQKIEMTVPVSTKVAEYAGVKEEQMGFYVPAEFQNSVPVPTSNEVKIVTRPAMIAYVREFGGYADDQDCKEHKLQLLKDLNG